MSKVVKVIDVRNGTSKAGKPYTINTVRLDDGVIAEGFGSVEPGDEVNVSYNDKFKKHEYQKSEQTNRDYAGSKAAGKVYKADPEKTESIVRQQALIQAREGFEKVETPAKARLVLSIADIYYEWLSGKSPKAQQANTPTQEPDQDYIDDADSTFEERVEGGAYDGAN